MNTVDALSILVTHHCPAVEAALSAACIAAVVALGKQYIVHI